VYGSPTASVVLADLERADLALVAGANPASNHPRLITQLVNLRRRGGKVIVVNPLRELGLVRFRIPSDARSLLFGSQVSDLYLQPHIGGDLALFTAMLKCLIEAGSVDHDFVARHTTGWEALSQDATAASWTDLEAQSGVPRDKIEEAASLLGRSRAGIFCWAMGLTHQPHGTDTIVALANLAMARGWLGRPGVGLLPIRGHSNVQGVGSVGVSPQLKAGFQAALEKLYGIPASRPPGWDTYASMLAAEAGQVDVAVLLGGNLLSANPDRHWATRAMQNIGTSVYLSTKLNEGHIHGRGRTTLVLPVLARDEESQSTTQESMFNFVRISEGGTPAVAGEMRSEVAIVAELAKRILPEGRFDWSAIGSHAHLRSVIALVVPGYAPLAKVDSGGGEFQIVGRTFHQPAFNTPDGKACFHITPRPAADHQAGFRLMTLRSEGQFNTVVYEEEDLYRGNRRRDVVMMARPDALSLNLSEGDRVIVQTSAGQMAVNVALVDIRPGNLAMYYPEANVLVPRTIDPQSKTPAFKFMWARIQPLPGK
jgi:molybdopterin-dependent oxidoreductase alpha subunit